MRYSFTLFLCFAAATVFAQAGQQAPDTFGVRVLADARLDVLVKKHEAIHKYGPGGGVIRSGKGFRIQIYNGNDRAAATKTKIDFIRRFPGTRSYMNYLAPTFRVRVGDFRSRGDAQKFYNDVSDFFTPCMIVPDIIEINTLRDGGD